MILGVRKVAVSRVAAAAVVAAFGLAAGSAPARADVLEIDAEGAHWITGAAAMGELSAAIAAPLREVPDEARLVPEPAVGDLAGDARDVPAGYAGKVAELSARYDLSPALIEALVWQESRWQAGATSPVGARGLAQLMPGTAREMGVDPNDPFANLEGGARYLRVQIDRFDGDIEKALAAYNAGPGRVIRSGGIPRIRETQVYVASIMGRLSDHARADQATADHSRSAD